MLPLVISKNHVLHNITYLCFVIDDSARGLAEGDVVERGCLCLGENVGEEGVNCVIVSELLLKNVELVHCVEDAMEERGKEVGLAVDVLHLIVGVSDNLILLFH